MKYLFIFVLLSAIILFSGCINQQKTIKIALKDAINYNKPMVCNYEENKQIYVDKNKVL